MYGNFNLFLTLVHSLCMLTLVYSLRGGRINGQRHSKKLHSLIK